MSMNELQKKVDELRELRRMADELAAEITALEDGIKDHMRAAGTDELHGQSFRITWKEVTSTRLDGKAIKAELPELWSRYSRQTVCRRFVLA